MNESWVAAIASAVLTLVGKIIFDWLKGKSKPADSESSGSKSVDFWTERMRDIVTEVIDAKIINVMSDQTRILVETLSLQNRVNEGIIRLIALEERSDRRG